mgnify:CR=1 FL=1
MTMRNDPTDTADRNMNAFRNAGKASVPTVSPMMATRIAIPIAEQIARPVRNVALALPYSCSETSASAALFSGAKVKPIASP